MTRRDYDGLTGSGGGGLCGVDEWFEGDAVAECLEWLPGP